MWEKKEQQSNGTAEFYDTYKEHNKKLFEYETRSLGFFSFFQAHVTINNIVTVNNLSVPLHDVLLNSPNSLSLSSEQRCSSSLIPPRSFSELAQTALHPAYVGYPRAGCSTPSGLSPEQRDRIPSCPLLSMLLWMQPRTRLVFWAFWAWKHILLGHV